VREVETNLKGEVVRFSTEGVNVNGRRQHKGEARTGHKSMVKAAGSGASTGFRCGGGLGIAGDAISKQECISGRAEVQQVAAVSRDYIISATARKGANGGNKGGAGTGGRVHTNSSTEITSKDYVPQQGRTTHMVLEGREARLQGNVGKFGGASGGDITAAKEERAGEVGRREFDPERGGNTGFRDW